MKKNLNDAVKFTNNVKDVKGVLQVILFGSVATGEDKEGSDIDIAIVFRGDRYEIMRQINKFKSDKIQTTFVDINGLAKETELVGAITGEGILLYGKPIMITSKKLGLNERMLISYSLSSLKQTEKVKLNRALYGSISISRAGKEVYKTETKGLVNEPGIDKIANTVLMIDRRKAAKIKALLKRFGAKFKEKVVWTY